MKVQTPNAIDFKELGVKTHETKAQKTKLDQEDFFALISAQLQHQDPMKPLDNADFVAQVAQFGTVDGIGKLNQSFDGLNDLVRGQQALQATTLVGHKVVVDKNQFQFQPPHQPEGIIENNKPLNQAAVAVRNANGETIRTLQLGPQGANDIAFQWDGKTENGQPAPPGFYTFSAEGQIGQENKGLNVNLLANVDGVTIGKSVDDLHLDLPGVGIVQLDQIKKIHA